MGTGHKKLQVVFAIDPSSGKHNPELPLSLTMEPEENGYFSALIEAIPPGILYGFRIDGSDEILPDPASRYQPLGIQGLSAPINATDLSGATKLAGVLKEEMYSMKYISGLSPERVPGRSRAENLKSFPESVSQFLRSFL